MTRSSVVLAVVAHPDDEVLGCGATLAALANSGAQVHVLCLSDGESSRFLQHDEVVSRLIICRRESALKAAEVLGLASIRFMDFPDNKLDAVPLLDIARSIESVVLELHPEIIFTHHGGDLNIDHRIVFQAVLTACRPKVGLGVRSIYSFEVASSTEWSTTGVGPHFKPNVFIDAEEFFEKKIKALGMYQAEIQSFPHPRSIEGVTVAARQRGVEGGVILAEAFVLLRNVCCGNFDYLGF